MQLRKILFITLFIILTAGFSKETSETVEIKNDFSVFKNIYTVDAPEIKTPTRVKILLPEQRYSVAILEQEKEKPEPWAGIEKKEKINLKIIETSQITNSGNSVNALADRLIDGDLRTTTEFDLDEDKGAAFAIIEGEKNITASSFQIILDENVALPKKIAIFAKINGEWKTVIAKTQLYTTTVNFPKTESSLWKIEMEHVQPLRIAELKLKDENKKLRNEGLEVIWLARPGKKYTVYSEAQANPKIITTEAGDLLNEKEKILSLKLPDMEKNPLFKEPDSDKDDVPNLKDNCIDIKNTDQKDLDENALGDACEDHDGDKVLDMKDNCPDRPNVNQTDTDGDKIGDECDNSENRITERLPWLPWIALSIVAILIILLFLHSAKQRKN